jgi:hypothetical protein
LQLAGIHFRVPLCFGFDFHCQHQKYTINNRLVQWER